MDRRRTQSDAPDPFATTLRRTASGSRLAPAPTAPAPAPAPLPTPRGGAISRSASRGAGLAAVGAAAPSQAPAAGGARGAPAPARGRQVLDAPALDARAVLARAADPRRARTQAGAAFVRGSNAAGTAPAPLAVLPSDAAGAAAAAAAASSDWALITPDGAVDRVVPNRAPLVAALGLEPRDLRLLDPRLADSYPSALLTRGAAVVVRLDTVKAVVTPDWALVADAGRGSVAAFVDALSAALRGNDPSTTATAPTTSKRRYGVTRLLSRGASRPPGLPTVPATAPSLTPRGGFGGVADDDTASLFHLSDDAPFELRFLEAALDWTASAFHVAVNAIETAARPCLRTPAASKLTTDFLKRLRALKSRIVVARVKLENVKEVLERLLDDDGDMEALVVSAAAAAGSAPATRPGAMLRALAAVTPAARAHAAASMGHAGGHAGGGAGAHAAGHAAGGHTSGHPAGDKHGFHHSHKHHPPAPKKRAPLFRRLAGRRGYTGGRPPAATAALVSAFERSSAGPGGVPPSPAATAAVAKALAARLERRSSASGGGSMHGCRVSALAAAFASALASSDAPPSSSTDDPRVRRDAVEQVLETVHARLVADFDRLASVTEAVEGVEVLLDIELDVFRNAYFKLGVLVNACSMGALALFGVTGYIAMNLGSPNSGEDIPGQPKWIKEWPVHSFSAFVAAALGSAALFMLGSVGLVAWMQWRGMAPLGLSSFGRQPAREGPKGMRR